MCVCWELGTSRQQVWLYGAAGEGGKNLSPVRREEVTAKTDWVGWRKVLGGARDDWHGVEEDRRSTDK